MRPDFRLGLGDNVFLRNPNGKVSMAGELWSGDSDDDTTDIAEVRRICQRARDSVERE